MLNKDVTMLDIDVAQWRNAQELLLDSAKQRQRIVVLHDAGVVRKVTHSDGRAVAEPPSRVDDPIETAKALYESNSGAVDFVAVFERSDFDAYFAAVQDSWDIDEELDAFVQRTYAMLDDFPDGLVTYPGSARTTLGLQWRLGASRTQLIEAVDTFIEADTTIVLGVFDGNALWASLVLTFDDARSVTAVTTADPTEVTLEGDKRKVASSVVDWVRTKHGTCSLGLFLDRGAAEAFLTSDDKLASLQRAIASGALLLSPKPPALTAALS
jgi:hypothetical protein